MARGIPQAGFKDGGVVHVSTVLALMAAPFLGLTEVGRRPSES